MKNLKAIGFVIAATMVLSGATALTASATNSQNINHKQNYCENSMDKSTDNRKPDASNWYKGILGTGKADFGRHNWYKGILDKLVTAGTITLAQETAIQTAITNAVKSGNGKFDVNTVLGGLVTAGTITANQQTSIVNAIKAAYTAKAEFSMNNRYKCILDKLVTAGTITLAQETAIQTAITNAVKSGNVKLDIKTILAGLVTDGTITANQQTAIVNAIPGAKSDNCANAYGYGHMNTNQNSYQGKSANA